MRKIIYIFIFLISITACKSTKNKKTVGKKNVKTAKVTTVPENNNPVANITAINNIIQTAEKYNGVRYKYGGTTNKGMDCSGLVTTAFKSENILLPRSAESMATEGNWVDVEEVQKGDLLFFATSKNNRSVNHVGLVTSARPGFVEFIHSTTSQGVITSMLSEKYWYFAFVQARRIL